MKISYAICVCDEVRELDTLLHFLKKVKNKHDEIVVLVDSSKKVAEIPMLLNRHKIERVFLREFKNDFAEHKNYLNRKCKGDYIFNLDADEVPTEELIRHINSRLPITKPDLVYVPRINMCLGQTEEFLKRWNFKANDLGWINWPDFQGRVFKNDKDIYWQSIVHEKIGGPGCKNIEGCEASPKLSLIHVKTVQKQNKQNEFYATF